MLYKDFQRVFIPGSPAIPEVLPRPEETVCVPAAGYTTVRYCTPPTYVLSGRGLTLIPGFCWTERVPNPGSQTPVCTFFPEVEHQPYVPAVPPRMQLIPSLDWDAGANSQESHAGNCEVRWNMGVVSGAYIGLSNVREGVADPNRLTHSILFTQRSGAAYFRIVEGGRVVSPEYRYVVGDEFAIRRSGGRVSYWFGENLVIESTVQSFGEVVVGTSLYASGDAVPTSTVDIEDGD